MYKINVHAGHNPSGKIACGASDLLDESNQARKIAKEVIRLLKKKSTRCTIALATTVKAKWMY